MSWFFIALRAPFLVASPIITTSFCCRDISGRKVSDPFSYPLPLFSGVAIPIVLFIEPHAYDISLVQGSALVATGMSSVFANVCYLYALDIDEASFVTPFYQLLL